MAPDRDEKRAKRIPIRFLDAEAKGDSSPDVSPADMDRIDPENDHVAPAETTNSPQQMNYLNRRLTAANLKAMKLKADPTPPSWWPHGQSFDVFRLRMLN